MNLTKIQFNPLGAQNFCAPFGSDKKEIPFLSVLGSIGNVVGAPLINGISSLIGGNQNVKAQKEINQQNIEEARAARRWQSEENVLSRDWQEKMWNLENQYNTPSAQLERMRAAGLNPFMVGSNSGIGSSSATVPQASSVGAPALPSLGVPRPGDALMQASQGFIGALGVNANVANQNANTLLTLSKAFDEWIASGVDYNKAWKMIEPTLKALNMSTKDIYNFRTATNYKAAQMKDESNLKSFEYQMVAQYGQREAKQKVENLAKTFEKMDSEINSLKSVKRMNEQSIKESVQRIKKMIEETTTIKDSRDSILKKLQFEAEILENDPMRSSFFSSASKSSPILKVLLELIKVLK